MENKRHLERQSCKELKLKLEAILKREEKLVKALEKISGFFVKKVSVISAEAAYIAADAVDEWKREKK